MHTFRNKKFISDVYSNTIYNLRINYFKNNVKKLGINASKGF